MMQRRVCIGDFRERIRRPVQIEDVKEYQLVTVRLHHKGVVEISRKRGSEIRTQKMYEVKAGDFILSGIDARHGAFGIVPDELDGVVVTNDFWYFKVDEEMIDKHLFLELTSTDWFVDLCCKGNDGTTQRIRLQKDKFFNQPVTLPPRDQQPALLFRLLNSKQTIKDLSAERKKQSDLLSKLRQAILQEAIQGKLTADWREQHPDVEPVSELLKRIAAEKAALVKGKKIRRQKPLPPITDEEIPFEIPEMWEWCRLGDIFLKLWIGPFGSLLHKSDYISGGTPLINPKHICDGQICPEEKFSVDNETCKRLSNYLIPKGAIIMARRVEMGRCAVVRDSEAGYLCGTGSLILEWPPTINTEYVVLYMRTLTAKNYFTDSSIGQTMQNLNKKILINMPICLPPFEEQQAIVECVQAKIALCDKLEAEITAAEQHVKDLSAAILQEVFDQQE